MARTRDATIPVDRAPPYGSGALTSAIERSQKALLGRIVMSGHARVVTVTHREGIPREENTTCAHLKRGLAWLGVGMVVACGAGAYADESPETAGALPNWMCTVGSADDDGPDSDADLARSELAPTGVLRVGVNYGNPNNAALRTVTLPDGTTAR